MQRAPGFNTWDRGWLLLLIQVDFSALPCLSKVRICLFPQAITQNSQLPVKRKMDKVSVAFFADLPQALVTQTSETEIMQTSLAYILERMVSTVIK